MTTHSDQPPLFDQNATPAVKRARKKATTPPPTTEDGLNTSDIIAGWVDWLKDGAGQTPPKTMIGMASRVVKQLICASYDSRIIKYALSIWTVEIVAGTMRSPSPTRLETIAWRLALDRTPAGRRWVAQMQAQVHEVSNSAKRARERSTLQAINSTAPDGIAPSPQNLAIGRN